MILVFIFIFIILLVMVLLLSSIKVNIAKFVVSNEKLEKEEKLSFVKELHIYFQLCFLNKIKIAQIELDKNKLMNLSINKIKDKMNKLDMQELKNNEWEKKEIKRAFKALKINLEQLNLKLEVGTEDVLLTTAIVTLISTGIGMVLPHVIRKYKKGKYYYKITPIYTNQNKINFDFKCIICTKMVHIIYVIYILIRMRRVKKDERTSNRRSYDYSYE